MPRSNRSRGTRRGGKDDAARGDADLTRALASHLHTDEKRDGLWHIQPLAAASATKFYTCPSCGLEIVPGMAHVVTWRADALMGDADAVAARRHWHNHCWKIKQ